MSDSRSIPDAPESSRIQIVESSRDRLVVALPKGGRAARGLGCFAVAWLLITAAVSIPMFGALLGFFPNMKWDGDPPPVWLMTLFFGVFWAVGIGMAYGWLKMTFTQTLLSLEPDRFAVQHELFGKKKLSVLELDATSKAELVEAYSQNDSPVYCIAVTGIGREEKFGTSLEPLEKEWLVQAINSFIGADVSETARRELESPLTSCPQCSAPMRAIESGSVCDACGYLSDEPLAPPQDIPQRIYPTFKGLGLVQLESIPELSPEDLPASSKIRVDDTNFDAVRISYVAVPPGTARYVLVGFMSLFCFLWFGGLTATLFMGISKFLKEGANGPQFLLIIMPAFMIVTGLVPLGVLCFVLFGRCSVLINGDCVRGRLQAGPFFKEKRIPTASIVDVGLGATSTTQAVVPIRGRKELASVRNPVAVIFSNEMSLPLSLSGDRAFNRQLAGLVAYQLRQFGHVVPHEDRDYFPRGNE